MQIYQKEFKIFVDFDSLEANTMQKKSICKLPSKRHRINTAKEAHKGLIMVILDFA